MAIDYVIDKECVPKATLSTMGILDRLKARARAEAIVRLYREEGDERPPTEMGVEVVNRALDGQEQKQTIVVQTLFDQASDLNTVSPACAGCPASLTRKPFGCFGSINYPISRAGELWLLEQLPTTEDPLPYLLLNQTLEEWPTLGNDAIPVRRTPGAIVETNEVFSRRLGDFVVNTNQIFELLFLRPSILPPFGAMLLLFFNAIPRLLEADQIRQLTPAPLDWQTMHPFRLTISSDDDPTIVDLKRFFSAVYYAYGLNVSLSLDA